MANIKLYNSLGKALQDFNKPLTETVTIYSCGPTVYDNIHLGNLAAFIYADSLKRMLVASGYQVKHAMNITDVSDKIITRAQTEYPALPPLDALKQVTEKYTAVFMDDIKLIGLDPTSYEFINATDAIDDMKRLIDALLASQFAYSADDGIYFSIEKYRNSGKIYGQLTEITEAGASKSRINNDEYDKNEAADFALWKKAKPNEPAWPLEVNGVDYNGRPGWHIECSAMSRSLLNQPFDIHTGGVDLKFPHHENEIAQSTANEINPVLAAYFIHNEHLLVNGQKMAKSLNNYITLRELTADGKDPLAFRLMTLNTHYLKQADYSPANFSQALDQLDILQALADSRHQTINFQAATHQLLAGGLKQSRLRFMSALQANLDTPLALQSLMQLAKLIREQGLPDSLLADFNSYLELVDQSLGLKLIAGSPALNEAAQSLVDERARVRSAGDFVAADKLRAQLNELGYGLDDMAFGQRWFKKRR